MCEFRAILDGKEVWEDVIYINASGEGVVLRDILGERRTLPNCRIVEVDVTEERLVLATV